MNSGFNEMASAQLRQFVGLGKKIAGAGLNYKALLKLRNLPDPKEPIIFLKASSSYITEGQSIEVKPGCNVHQEVELGIIIGKRCRNISENEALNYVGGYCLALDMTEASMMMKCRESGIPWTLGKAMDTFCPVSRFVEKEELPDPNNVRLWSKVNGELKQDSTTADMYFSISQLISFISQYMTLEPCDLILTGSPPGMGPVQPGDTIECGLENILVMKFPVKSA